MSNRYHLLLETPDEKLSDGMSQLNGIYSPDENFCDVPRKQRLISRLSLEDIFSGKYDRAGRDVRMYDAVVNHGYKLKEVAERLLELMRFLAFNPVKPGQAEKGEIHDLRHGKQIFHSTVVNAHTDLVATIGGDGNTITSSNIYTPYGEVLSHTGTLNLPLTYQSDYTDASTGLIDMGRRNYDPSLGVFTTTDPKAPEVTDPYSYNTYLYTNDCPAAFIDTTASFLPCCESCITVWNWDRPVSC